MITKRDCILLLSELSARGIKTDSMLNRAVKSPDIDLEVVKFINNHRQFEANAFYEKLRKSYNNKKSMLYKNIVTCDEEDCTDKVLTTLAALNLQILLYMKNVEDAKMEWLKAAIEDGIQINDPEELESYSGQFKLRISKSLHKTLSEDSKKEGVSMNQYCVYLLSRNDAVYSK